MFRTTMIGAAIAVMTLIPMAAEGQHSISNLDGSTALVGVKGVSIPVVKRMETRSLVDLGTVDTDAYERIVVNLAGQLLGADATGGTVGVILIPDISPYDQAFSGMGLLPASLEITVDVNTRGTGYFMANQQKFDVGFPRYRALAYNSTNSPATISFFVFRSK